jgi:hypothetical protein
MREIIRFGDTGTTSLLPLTAVLLAIACLLVLLAPRWCSFASLVFFSVILPAGQHLVPFGIHLMPYRVLLIFGLVRMLVEKGSRAKRVRPGRSGGLEPLILAYCVAIVVTFSLLWMDGAALINRCGIALSIIGTYYIWRWYLVDAADIDVALKVIAALCSVLAITMTVESVAGMNPLQIIGMDAVPMVREGRIRAAGSFGHPILAGVFGACWFPAFAGLWAQQRNRTAALFGMLATTVMVVTSASSTPVSAYAGAVLALGCWPVRRRLRLIRWGLVAAVASLALVMKDPVWYVIARVSFANGSTAYHRAVLIDAFVKHWPEWFLLGTKSTTHWGWALWDTANQYVEVGTTGGLVSFVLFIFLFQRAFSMLGRLRRAVVGSRLLQWRTWSLGASLVAHLFGFFGVSYFDQSLVSFYGLLAIVSAAAVVYPQLLRQPGND